MIKSKKQMYIVIGAFALVLTLLTTTYAFFNYTRTGSANVIKTGRIYFNSEQGTAINLTNMFPIDVSGGIPNDNTKVGTVTLNVTGDTTYDEGIEYLVSAVNVQNTVGSGANAKALPISIDVSVTSNTTNNPVTTLGTVDSSYFTNRGGNSSIYKVLANDTINNNDQLLVGYVTKGSTGIDGNIVIRAYLDKAKVAITDTYDGTESDNMGTTTTWVDERVVFTTTEWNSLQANGVSFQIKVESNEGVWVEEPFVIPTMSTMCPNCVFMYSTSPVYRGTRIGTVLQSSNYRDNYMDVVETSGKPYFYGFKINSETNIVEREYICGIIGENINNGTPFCVEITQDETRIDSISTANRKNLKYIFGENSCRTFANGTFNCVDSISNVGCSINENIGVASVYTDDVFGCSIDYNDYAWCV